MRLQSYTPKSITDHLMHFFFLFIGREPTTSANNCLQIMGSAHAHYRLTVILLQINLVPRGRDTFGLRPLLSENARALGTRLAANNILPMSSCVHLGEKWQFVFQSCRRAI